MKYFLTGLCIAIAAWAFFMLSTLLTGCATTRIYRHCHHTPQRNDKGQFTGEYLYECEDEK